MRIVFFEVSSSQRNSCQLADAYIKIAASLRGGYFVVYTTIVSRRAFARLRPDIACEAVMTLA